MGRSLCTLVATAACLVGSSAAVPASSAPVLASVAPAVARADTINPDREFLKGDTNAVRWCATNFQNVLLTPYVGCDVGGATVTQLGIATTVQVAFRQHVAGLNFASACGPGGTRCINRAFWKGTRKVIVRLRPNRNGVLKIRRIFRKWRCDLEANNGPAGFLGVPCFIHDPKTPKW